MTPEERLAAAKALNDLVDKLPIDVRGGMKMILSCAPPETKEQLLKNISDAMARDKAENETTHQVLLQKDKP